MTKISNETTPLLIASEAGPTTQNSQTQDEGLLVRQHSNKGNAAIESDVEEEDVPLPKLQIFVLCVARVIEPMAFFAIFPFVNKMIWETGDLDESDVGFYSGFIESMFSFTQMLLMIMWGKASDRVGRKPVMVFSLMGVAIGTALFGFSKTIWQMIMLRCATGVFSGTVVTIRTMITENSTPKTQARAFSLFAFSGNLGILIGPLIGGGLAEPAKQYPKVFGHWAIFKQFPYALPTVVNGVLAFAAALFCALFLKETLKRRVKDDTSTPPPMDSIEIIRSPGVGTVLFLYGHVMLLGLAYTAVSPVYWFTDVSLGGCSFSPNQISYFLAGIGISQSIWLLFIFPPLQLKYGTGTVLRWCLYAWPVFFTGAPISNWLLRNGWTTAFWVVAPTIQIGGAGVAMAFTAVQLALNDISPSQQSLGTLNGIALTLTAAIRTVGPSIFTSLFAVGARTQFLDGYFVWAVLIFVGLLGSVGVRYFPDKAQGRAKKHTAVEG